jgi:hypothetical protein
LLGIDLSDQKVKAFGFELTCLWVCGLGQVMATIAHNVSLYEDSR